ncbi:hypothetical protein [Actinophytocola sp.]|uniref:hypothetical protein n=1 Tax=Actinophytocola sp. TaxID=1872138 RepID=UPI002D61ED17|nr:hypothetical protein [Actinophytocola sp.]HYQ69343.1 hypothetical protein [Actinophytocola sp.]
MLDGFITWLDSYISRERPSAVMRGMIGLMAFAGLLGTVSGKQAIRAGAFVVVIVIAVSTMLALLADRRRLTRENDTNRGLLSRYCDSIAENSGDPLVRIEHWRQHVEVRPNGDVTETLTLRAVALRRQVEFIRLTAGCRWDQPDRYRRRVQVIARSLTINGAPGTRWNVTTSWRSVQKLTSVLHLHVPIKRGQMVTFEVTRTWPAKCRPLINGEAEEFTLRTTSLLDIQHVEYTIVLPQGAQAVYEEIGAGEPDVQLSTDADGGRIFTWRAEKTPTLTEVGIRLELK